eukprot:760407-Rhodomonas_salina.1
MRPTLLCYALRTCYTISGTSAAYPATLHQFWHSRACYALRVRCAMSGTGIDCLATTISASAMRCPDAHTLHRVCTTMRRIPCYALCVRYAMPLLT